MATYLTGRTHPPTPAEAGVCGLWLHHAGARWTFLRHPGEINCAKRMVRQHVSDLQLKEPHRRP